MSYTIDDVTMNEGNSGPTSFVFTVTKSGTTALTSTVDFMTAMAPRRWLTTITR